MLKLFSTRYPAGAFNIAILLLRLVFAGIMLTHGFQKLSSFHETAGHMPHFLGLSQSATASLVIFAEFFCSLFLILGLFTRVLTIPLIICMSYIFFVIGNGSIEKSEIAVLYLCGFLVLLLVGPGKYSLDSILSGKR